MDGKDHRAFDWLVLACLVMLLANLIVQSMRITQLYQLIQSM